MRLYHPLVLEVVGSILREAADEKQAVRGYALAAHTMLHSLMHGVMCPCCH